MKEFSREEKVLLLAALLHDVGKIKNRIPGNQNEHHKDLGGKWVKEFLGEKFPSLAEEVAELVYNHHDPKIKGELLAILIRADGLSSSEREEREDKGDVAAERLIPILSRLGSPERETEKRIPLKILGEFSKSEIFPSDDPGESYGNLWNKFDMAVKQLPDASFHAFFTSLYYLLYKYTWSVPSAAYVHKPTISLFDHLRTTAAIALCLYRAKGKRKPFALIKGDVTGIQRFIYGVASPDDAQKGMAKRLRGRSLFVQLLTESVARKFMDELGLPETNLLWLGGGNFVLLAPNEDGLGAKLEEVRAEIDRRLLERFHGRLGVVVGWAPASEEEISPSSRAEGVSCLLRRVEENLLEAKQRKFSSLEEWPEPELSEELADECPVCGAPMKKPPEGAEGRERFCEECRRQEELGERLPKADYLVWLNKNDLGVPLGEECASVEILGQVWALCEKEPQNDLPEGYQGIVFEISGTDAEVPSTWARGFKPLAKHLPAEGHEILDFDSLSKKAEGAKYLAALRGDVDNMGYLLTRMPKPSFSAYASVSRSLSFFFEGFLEYLAREEYGEYLYIVYAGGDDFFVVGTWDKVLDFARRVNELFGEYALNKELTLSVGYEFFKPKEPIGRVAFRAGDAEDEAKKAGKNRIYYMGEVYSWGDFGEGLKAAEEILGKKDEISRSTVMNLLEIYRREFKRGRPCWVAKVKYQLVRNVKDEGMRELVITKTMTDGRMRSSLPLWTSVFLLKTRKEG